jgi:ABC-2 type transport system permease protein
VVVFAGATSAGGGNPPAALRPLMAFGAGGMVIFLAGLQLLGNQFGYDRAGFRAYVLSPVSRRDVLFGKNLAVAPLLLGLGLFAAAVVGVVYPLRVDHYPLVVAQLLTTYLIVCLATNVVAILAPIPLAPGSMQPSSVKAGPVLLQMLLLMLLPVLVLPAVAPYGLEVLLDQLDVVKGVPVALPLSLVVLALVGLAYRWLIRAEGDWLASREQAILDVVTSKAE